MRAVKNSLAKKGAVNEGSAVWEGQMKARNNCGVPFHGADR